MFSHFSWYEFFSGGAINHHNIHIFSAAVITFIIVAISLLAYSKLKNTEERVIPASSGTLANVWEVSVEALYGLVESIVGPDAKTYFPLIGSMFIYIFLCNASGLIPGFLPPTDNINTNLAVSITVFVYYNAMGIKSHGIVGYLKHFLGPILWLGPLMAVIELIGHLVRPLSLALRLYGNITGDHLVLGIFTYLAPVVVPVIFLTLGLFVSFIQAFVFSLLSTIYIGLATAHEHDEHDHGHDHQHAEDAHADGTEIAAGHH